MTVVVLALALLALQDSLPRTLDDFEPLVGWTAHPADGVDLAIRPGAGYRGRGMRLDFAFRAGGGYAVARKRFPLDLPDDYEFSFYIRGAAPNNTLEFKLIDSTGDNVWWSTRRDFSFPPAWTKITIKKRQIGFAWGPVGGGEIRRSAAIEIVVTAGSGGVGSVWIDELTLRQRLPPMASGPPVARARSSAAGAPPAAAVDGDSSTMWRSGAAGAQRQWLTLDFGKLREYGGLIIDWDQDEYAADYDVATSGDGRRWNVVARVRGGTGGRAYHYLPEQESRYLRLDLRRSARGRGYEVAEVAVQPLEFSATANSFFAAIAARSPPGSYPRYFSGRQSYWTVVGVSGGTWEALLNDDGMLEAKPRGFSLEPFLWTGGRLVTWSDAQRKQSLTGNYLPIPAVSWRAGDVQLTVTAIASGAAGAPTLLAHYRVANLGTARVTGRLFVALRPFQVNPPWQFLNTPGGVATIRRLTYDGHIVTVNDTAAVMSLSAADGFGAATFMQGGVTAALRRGVLPAARGMADSSGWASGALSYAFDLAPGATRDVALAVVGDMPIATQPPAAVSHPAASRDSAAAHIVASALAMTAADWDEQLNRVVFTLPPAADRFLESLKAALGHVLINRIGPAIHPGPRAYARAWIRDGALISAALLRLRHPAEVREFIEWYAPHQYANGKIPCCVDARGSDPVPEHDSNGEFIYLIAEYYRFTRDTAFLRRLWPRLTAAAGYIDSLRRERLTAEYRAPDRREVYGLLPPSISHEGYSAKPMHSYWDDFWALRGIADAAFAADELGERAAAARWMALRDAFRADILASLAAAMQRHGIDYLPGAADLGDFDAPSTAVAIAPGGELHHLPAEAVRRTFDRYFDFFLARREGTADWSAYAPYELRVAGVFVRLGEPERAWALLDYFLRDQRPIGWKQWPEVVWRDPEAPKFLGDLPHTWVGAEFLRSAIDLFAFERERDSSLVLAAGVPPEWTTSPSGIGVRRLGTVYGALSYSLRAARDTVWVRIDAGVSVPPGGVIVGSPLRSPRPIRAATVNGEPAHLSPAGEITVRTLPAEIIVAY